VDPSSALNEPIGTIDPTALREATSIVTALMKVQLRKVSSCTHRGASSPGRRTGNESHSGRAGYVSGRGVAAIDAPTYDGNEALRMATSDQTAPCGNHITACRLRKDRLRGV
jgi:hypothetical protein